MLINCPICNGTSELLDDKSSERSIQGIERYLAAECPKELITIRYSLFQCKSCGLQFADPMADPNKSFYVWLTNSGFKYPSFRWEWEACSEILKSLSQSTGKLPIVLDFGCGDGGFLKLIKKENGINGIGIDTNPEVIKICRAQGLIVFEANFEGIRDRLQQKADMITLWHIVEHVGNPVELLNTAKSMINKNGMICFSVPLSPMSYEHSWPDPFNLPPHHLTRWDIGSLEALANKIQMKMLLKLPNPNNFFYRIVRGLYLQTCVHDRRGNRVFKSARVIIFTLLHPWQIIKEIKHQWHHPKYNGQAIPDFVLVCLKNL